MLATATLALGILAPLPALAGTNPLGAVDCSGQASNSSLCVGRGNTEDPLTGPNGTIIRAANVMALVAGFVAVIFLVIGGIKYVTSGGDSSGVASAKNTVIYALVGLVIIALSRSILGFVLGRL